MPSIKAFRPVVHDKIFEDLSKKTCCPLLGPNRDQSLYLNKSESSSPNIFPTKWFLTTKNCKHFPVYYYVCPWVQSMHPVLIFHYTHKETHYFEPLARYRENTYRVTWPSRYSFRWRYKQTILAEIALNLTCVEEQRCILVD